MVHLVDGGLVLARLVRDRVVHVAVDQALDRTVERGREEHRLVRRGDAVEDLLDLGHEAHVGHAVGFVDHEHLDRRERQLLALEQVDEAPGGADDDVDALLQGGDLRVHRDAAVDGPHLAVAHLAERAERVGDLGGQLAGRDEDQGLGPAGLGLADAPEEGKAEGQGLARAGLGLAEHVAPGEGVGDGELLDREGLGDALARQGRDQVGVQAEAREGCGHCGGTRFRRIGTECPPHCAPWFRGGGGSNLGAATQAG